MSEPLATMEEMIRSLGKDINPVASLRQRILAASNAARERQLSRIRIVRNSCWCVACLCVVYIGSQVPWSHFQTLVGPYSSELFAAKSSALINMQGLHDGERAATVDQAEDTPSPVFAESVEWEMAESQWKRRDRQSELISHYF